MMIYRTMGSESFWNIEMIQIALNINNKEVSDLRKFISEGEFIDYTSGSNFKKKIGGLIKRIEVLDSVLINELAIGDTKTSEFITFYSILKNERIVYDFLNEIVFSDFIKLKKYITREEIDSFIIEKSRQIEKVGNWSNSSKDRMKSKIIEFFIKGGYLLKRKNDYSIVLPSVSKRVREHLLKTETLELNNILFFQKGI